MYAPVDPCGRMLSVNVVAVTGGVNVIADGLSSGVSMLYVSVPLAASVIVP